MCNLEVPKLLAELHENVKGSVVMTLLHKRVLLFLVFMFSVALVNFPVFGEKLNGTVMFQEKEAFQLIKMKGSSVRNDDEEYEEEETGEEEPKIFKFDCDSSIFKWNLGNK